MTVEEAARCRGWLDCSFRRRITRSVSIAQSRTATAEPTATPTIGPAERPLEPEAPLVLPDVGEVIADDQEALLLVDACELEENVAAISFKAP